MILQKINKYLFFCKEALDNWHAAWYSEGKQVKKISFTNLRGSVKDWKTNT